MGTAGWTARRNVAIEDVQKNIPDFQIDSSERKEGRNSLHLPPSPAKTTWSVNSGDFPVEPGKAYTASFWVKAEKPTKLLFGIYAVPEVPYAFGSFDSDEKVFVEIRSGRNLAGARIPLENAPLRELDRAPAKTPKSALADRLEPYT